MLQISLRTAVEVPARHMKGLQRMCLLKAGLTLCCLMVQIWYRHKLIFGIHFWCNVSCSNTIPQKKMRFGPVSLSPIQDSTRVPSPTQLYSLVLLLAPEPVSESEFERPSGQATARCPSG